MIRLKVLTVPISAYADVGIEPIDFPSAPSLAVPIALKNGGLTLDDISLFEINEAYSVVVRIFEKVLGVDSAKINVNGYVISDYCLELADSCMSQRCCRSRPRDWKLGLSYHGFFSTCAQARSVWGCRYLQRSTSIALPFWRGLTLFGCHRAARLPRWSFSDFDMAAISFSTPVYRTYLGFRLALFSHSHTAVQ